MKPICDGDGHTDEKLIDEWLKPGTLIPISADAVSMLLKEVVWLRSVTERLRAEVAEYRSRETVHCETYGRKSSGLTDYF